MLRRHAPARELVLITDPGPDPDDVKALLIAGTLHKRGDIQLRLVVANGGHQARERARLAQCLLDAIGVRSVPVAIGSEGQTAYEPVAHEYLLKGYDAVDDARLEPDGRASLLRVLDAAASKSLVIVCISSLRDLADVIGAQPALVLDRVARVAVQAGLDFDEASSRWVPDTSVNNGFDPDAAAAVYDFCFGNGLPLTVVSRHAVPLLPMQLARSFAERTASPVMAYLANAQFLGLRGLWLKLCDGKLPARCTKQWYFETFCGVDAARFAAQGFETLDATADILPHLNGYVKPYDVCALMAVLPHKPGEAFDACAVAPPRLAPGQPAAAHRLHLAAEHGIDVTHVTRLLRHVYHDIVLATVPPSTVNPRLGFVRRSDRSELLHSAEDPSLLQCVDEQERLKSWKEPRRAASENPGATSAAGHALLDAPQIIELFHRSLELTGAQLQHSSRVAACMGILFFMGAAATVFWAFDTEPPPGAGRAHFATRKLVGEAAFDIADLAIAVGVLALQPVASHRRATTATAAAIVAASLLFAVPAVPQAAEALRTWEDDDAVRPAPRACDEVSSPAAWRLAHGVWLAQSVLAYFCFDLWLARVWLMTRRHPSGWAQTVRVRALWSACMVNLALQSCTRALLSSTRCANAVLLNAEPAPAFLLPALLSMHGAAVLLYAALLAPGGRLRAKALLMRLGRGRPSARRVHAEAPLAPLIGYGSLVALEPSRLVPEALRGMRAATLGPRTVRALTLDAGEQSTPQAGRRGRAGAGAGGAASSPGVTGGKLGSPHPRAALAQLCHRSSSAVAPISSEHSICADAPSAKGGSGSGAAPGPEPSGRRGSSATQSSRSSCSLCSSSRSSKPSSLSGGSAVSHSAGGSTTATTTATTTVTAISPSGRAKPEASPSSLGGSSALWMGRSSSRGSPLGPPPLSRPGNSSFLSDASTPRSADGGSSVRTRFRQRLSRRSVRAPPRRSSSEQLSTTIVDIDHDRALTPDSFDVFVLHSERDPPAERLIALSAWAREFRAARGRWPRVWLDSLCADPIVDRRERLAHEVVAMCRARTLLCLVGASFVARLACIGRLLAWRATGGSLDDVEVVLVGADAAEFSAIVAAVDAFHVVYAEHTARPRASSADDQGPLVHAIELAGARRVNELVHSLLPQVQRAVPKALQRARPAWALGRAWVAGLGEPSSDNDDDDDDDDDDEPLGADGSGDKRSRRRSSSSPTKQQPASEIHALHQPLQLSRRVGTQPQLPEDEPTSSSARCSGVSHCSLSAAALDHNGHGARETSPFPATAI